MGIIDLFKKKRSGFTDKASEFESRISYKGIPIVITDNIEESKRYLIVCGQSDYIIENGRVECIFCSKNHPFNK